MKAAIFNLKQDGKFTTSHRKENNYYNEFSAIAKDSTGFHVPVTLRTYYTKSGQSNTACIWVNGSKKEIHVHGSGSAGGGGYHRPSAAAEEAIRNAGIELAFPINGRGDEMISQAVKCIAVSLGFKESAVYVHKSNG